MTDKDSKIVRRHLVEIPHLSQIGNAEIKITDICDFDSNSVRKNISSPIDVLLHELSRFYTGHLSNQYRRDASLAEFKMLKAYFEKINFAIESEVNFSKSLLDLNSLFIKSNTQYRQNDVGLDLDKDGNQVIFPRAAHIRNRLNDIRLLIKSNRLSNPLGIAVTAYALFLNVHPFEDGNGRVARVLFNYILQSAGMSRASYIPLYELNWWSCGGYQIALREAEIFGRWEHFKNYINGLVTHYKLITLRKAHG